LLIDVRHRCYADYVIAFATLIISLSLLIFSRLLITPVTIIIADYRLLLFLLLRSAI